MGMSTPIPMKDPADYIEFDEAEKILSLAKDIREKVIIGLLWRCGLRAFEVGRLQIKHLDMNEGIIIVHGKGNQLKRMPVEPELLAWLGVITLGRGAEDFIIMGRKQKGISRITVWKIVDRCSKKAGVLVTKSNRRMHPHAFRHSLAIWMVRMGMPLPKIQQILRHSSLGPTTYYLQFSAKELSEDYLKAWETAKKPKEESKLAD